MTSFDTLLLELWFLPPVLALLAGVLALAPLGAQVLARGVVFIDLAMALGDHPHWAVTQAVAAAGALLAAGLVATLARAWAAQREALIGLVYVACACAALLTARGDAHGAEHLHALLAADLLWSGWRQVATLALCAAAVTVMGRRLERDAWFYAGFALVASQAVQVLGLFVVFAALIAPGLWQRAGARRVTAMAGAVAAAGLGLAASWELDAPSGPLVALALALFGAASGLRAGTLRRPG
ncbi:MAG: metal ABC transporter permease [Ramlibacter sp.]